MLVWSDMVHLSVIMYCTVTSTTPDSIVSDIIFIKPPIASIVLPLAISRSSVTYTFTFECHDNVFYGTTILTRKVCSIQSYFEICTTQNMSENHNGIT